jgi:hypothetical protein
LTRHTIAEFYLAPAGTTSWGDNQCKNDKDGTVDSDERLRITGVDTGTYDAKLKDISVAAASSAISKSRPAKSSQSKKKT